MDGWMDGWIVEGGIGLVAAARSRLSGPPSSRPSPIVLPLRRYTPRCPTRSKRRSSGATSAPWARTSSLVCMPRTSRVPFATLQRNILRLARCPAFECEYRNEEQTVLGKQSGTMFVTPSYMAFYHEGRIRKDVQVREIPRSIHIEYSIDLTRWSTFSHPSWCSRSRVS